MENSTFPSTALGSSSINSLLQKRAEAEKELMATITPTEAETAATNRLSQIGQTATADINVSANRLAPTFAIAGEQAAIQRRADAARAVATDELQALISAREAQNRRAQAGLTIAERAVAEEQARLKPIEVSSGQSLVRLNPETGQYETIVQAPTKRDTSTINLGGRQVLIDNQTGEAIRDLGAAPTGQSYGGILAGLPASIQGRVISQANSFSDSAITKRYNATIDAINLINGISPTTQNPADHQAVVYAFAKMLDPDSVVREGEYATIKQYAQSLLNRYGKEITNALNGTGFLSQDAISNIQNTMNQTLRSRTPQYQNLKQQTSNIIDAIAGVPVANELLVDFSAGVTPQTAPVAPLPKVVSNGVDLSAFNTGGQVSVQQPQPVTSTTTPQSTKESLASKAIKFLFPLGAGLNSFFK